MAAAHEHPIILVEGIDGSGKDTVVDAMVDALDRCAVFGFPTRITRAGIWARRALKHGIPDVDAWQKLCNLDRRDMKGIIEAARRLMPVILNRYSPSGYAYARIRGADSDTAKRGEDMIAQPTHVVFVQCSPQDADGFIADRETTITREVFENRRDLAEVAPMFEEAFDALSFTPTVFENGRHVSIQELRDRATKFIDELVGRQ